MAHLLRGYRERLAYDPQYTSVVSNLFQNRNLYDANDSTIFHEVELTPASCLRCESFWDRCRETGAEPNVPTNAYGLTTTTTTTTNFITATSDSTAERVLEDFANDIRQLLR